MRRDPTSLSVLKADESGTNLNGKNHWLHCIASPKSTLFYAHPKRGTDAIEFKEVLNRYQGILVHDHWKPSFKLSCQNALCNAHRLRELTYAHEQEQEAWAKRMRKLLLAINQRVKHRGGVLPELKAQGYRTIYRTLLKIAEQERPEPQKIEATKGRVKRRKSGNLLERLRDLETEILRFMIEKAIPFTNNQGEDDIRMTHFQQKI